jgi:hypothetical protein
VRETAAAVEAAHVVAVGTCCRDFYSGGRYGTGQCRDSCQGCRGTGCPGKEGGSGEGVESGGGECHDTSLCSRGC